MRSAGRMLGGMAVALATAGMLVAGGGIAAADEGDGEPAPPPITLTPEQSAKVCTERIPRLLDRIDRLQTRIDAGADTPGSTARLAQRLQQARDAGRTEVADRLQQRLDRRPEQVGKLAAAQRRITAFRDEKCG